MIDTNEVKKEIKRILKGYKRMDKKTRAQLLQLGFVITDDGKHYKITHPSTSSLMVTVGKTVSDFRAGRNTAKRLCCLV